MIPGTKMAVFAIVMLGIFAYSPNVFSQGIDSDRDGLNDEREVEYKTDVLNPDTDGDGFADGEEVLYGFSPHEGNGKVLEPVDTDKDKLLDWQEIWFGTDINQVDSDEDGYSDYDEVMAGYSPRTSVTSTRLNKKVLVDRTSQKLHYFVDGVRMLTMPVSTGNPVTPTPSGTFKIQRKVPVMRYVGRDYDFKGVKWNMQFFPHYYIHTAYWHNDFGKRTRSHGCVNMREKDAEILFKYLDVGTTVSIIGNTPKRAVVGT